MMRHYKWFIHYKINIVNVWSLIDRTINHEYLSIQLFNLSLLLLLYFTIETKQEIIKIF